MDVFTWIFIAVFVINGVYLLDVSSFSKRLGSIGSDGGSSTLSPFNAARAQQLLGVILSPRSKVLDGRPDLHLQVMRIRGLLALSMILFVALIYVAFTQT